MSTKNQILELLEKSRGESLSGEKIAKLLHVSRNAIWKAINELKKDGYKIQAVTNKGYMLTQDNDILSCAGILSYLSDSYKPVSLDVYDTIDSTNRTAKEMAISGAKHGSIVIANSQSAGRGRYTRSFFSPANGGLYISFVLHPDKLPFKNITSITAFASLVVCETIENLCDKTPKIKWVNDVYLKQKKICGILTESITVLESSQPQWIVLGIGINVNTPDSSFPEEIRSVAGSIFPDGDAVFSRNQLAAEIIQRVLYPSLDFNETILFKAYKEKLMMLGSKITVIQGAESYNATAIDLDDLGHLIIEKENGIVETLHFGEISIRMGMS